MDFRIYNRQYLTVGSLLFASLICLCAVLPGEIRNPHTNCDQSELSEIGITKSGDTLVNNISVDIGTSVKIFRSVAVDNDNTKWFVTEKGIVSFNGEKWILHDKNEKVPTLDLKNIAFEVNPHGQELWIASPKGATVASIPVESLTGATTYHVENTPILSNNVIQVAIGKSPLRWFGTDKGISAFFDSKWLKGDYEDQYPESMFQDYPITAMATSADGDSLYVATDGVGIARVLRNDIDGITAASSYAQWGPILLPSDNIYSIFIASDNTQWFGTDKGIARHIGNNTLKNWTVFTSKDGLIDNFVQAIAADKIGHIWIGTRGGLSVFDGSSWSSFTKDNGLNSNNILCITFDKTGIVWLGTDDGVASYADKKFTNYR